MTKGLELDKPANIATNSSHSRYVGSKIKDMTLRKICFYDDVTKEKRKKLYYASAFRSLDVKAKGLHLLTTPPVIINLNSGSAMELRSAVGSLTRKTLACCAPSNEHSTGKQKCPRVSTAIRAVTSPLFKGVRVRRRAPWGMDRQAARRKREAP